MCLLFPRHNVRRALRKRRIHFLVNLLFCRWLALDSFWRIWSAKCAANTSLACDFQHYFDFKVQIVRAEGERARSRRNTHEPNNRSSERTRMRARPSHHGSLDSIRKYDALKSAYILKEKKEKERRNENNSMPPYISIFTALCIKRRRYSGTLALALAPSTTR